jgi:sugar diacid utilization regulator
VAYRHSSHKHPARCRPRAPHQPQAPRPSRQRLAACGQDAIYEDLGILGLLIAGPKGTALADFASTTLGTVLQHDRSERHQPDGHPAGLPRHQLHQCETAAKLFVHAKTVKYRLEVIHKLTSLSLSEHHDRMRADIAVRTLDLH